MAVQSRAAASSGASDCSTPQARRPTRSGEALGARTRAAAMAASRASSPCAALPNRVRDSASMPTISPRKRSEEHTSELQSPCNLVCRLLLEKKKTGPRNGQEVGYEVGCQGRDDGRVLYVEPWRRYARGAD